MPRARIATKYLGECVLCDRKMLKGQWVILDYETRVWQHSKCRGALLRAVKENNPVAD